MRIRALAMDVTITSDGPDEGSPEVSAVLAQFREMIAGDEPDSVQLLVPRGNRQQRRQAAAQARGRP